MSGRFALDPARKKGCLILGIVGVGAGWLVVIGGAALWILLLVGHQGHPDYERFTLLKLGMTEAEVVGAFGSPWETHYAPTPPEEYCVGGYVCDDRPIKHKLLIYKGSVTFVYVYLDEESVVEHTFFGGS